MKSFIKASEVDIKKEPVNLTKLETLIDAFNKEIADRGNKVADGMVLVITEYCLNDELLKIAVKLADEAGWVLTESGGISKSNSYIFTVKSAGASSIPDTTNSAETIDFLNALAIVEEQKKIIAEKVNDFIRKFNIYVDDILTGKRDNVPIEIQLFGLFPELDKELNRIKERALAMGWDVTYGINGNGKELLTFERIRK